MGIVDQPKRWRFKVKAFPGGLRSGICERIYRRRPLDAGQVENHSVRKEMLLPHTPDERVS